MENSFDKKKLENLLAEAIKNEERAGKKRIELKINIDEFRLNSPDFKIGLCSPNVTDD